MLVQCEHDSRYRYEAGEICLEKTRRPVKPLRKHTRVAVTDILAVGLILIGASFSFGGLVTAPTEAAFGEATSFYGTPLQIAREALADYGAVPMWNMRTGAGESLVANPLAIHFYPFALY